MTMPRKKTYINPMHFAGEFVVPAEENEISEVTTELKAAVEKKSSAKRKPKKPARLSKADHVEKRASSKNRRTGK